MSLIGAGTVVGEGSFSHICHGGNRHCVVTLKLWGSTPCGLPNCRTDTCRGAGTDVARRRVLAKVVSPTTTCGGDLTDILFSATRAPVSRPYNLHALFGSGRITSKLTA
jgi:hypothetical protein